MSAWRWLAAAFSLPSGALLLAKIYGLLALHVGLWAVLVPATLVLLLLVWSSSRRGHTLLVQALVLGSIGGLVGSVAYDVVRVPFHLLGHRVFGAISVFGLWVTNAELSSRLTEAAGWAYHYTNGVSFGVLYALFMRGRHWGFGVAWALILESIAVFTVFGDIFFLRGNATALLIAYVAHVPYGFALGKVVQDWEHNVERLSRLTFGGRFVAVLLATAVFVWPLLVPYPLDRDQRARAHEFQVEGPRLNPSWLRIERGDGVTVRNRKPEAIRLVNMRSMEAWSVPPGGQTRISFERSGLFQLFVETGRRSRSSFVLVEPIEATRREKLQDH